MKMVYVEAHAKQRKDEYNAKLNSAKGKVYKFVDSYIACLISLVVAFGCFIGNIYFAKNGMELCAWGTLGALIVFFVLNQIFTHKSEAFLKMPLEVVFLNALQQGGEKPTLILKKNEGTDTCLIKLEIEKDGVFEAKEIGQVKIEFCSFAVMDEQTLDFTKEVLFLPLVACENFEAHITIDNFK